MDSYVAFRIFMGFIGSTLAIILGLVGFFNTLDCRYLILLGFGILGEFICYVMCKNRSKKEKDNNENIDKENDNEKD